MPPVASEFAAKVDVFYWFMVLMSLFWVVAIGAVVAFYCVRYRRRYRTQRPDEIHGNNRLEAAWTVIPFVLAMGMFFWAAHLFFDYAQSPGDAMEILVTGKQWMWRLQHPDGTREINALHIPVGQPIKLTMTSEDVIHSFYIPAFRVKADVVPGRYTRTWFTPTKTGKFHLFCAEYCGTEHSKMGGYVTVLTPREYDEWLATAGATGGGVAVARLSPAAAGERLFTRLGCVTCHGAEPGALGPSLIGLFGRQEELADGTTIMADEDYIRQSILYPQRHIVKGYQPVMPSFEGQVSETQLLQLVAYIKSIGSQKIGVD
jgi:cytochrome c oxidase subunit 2